MSEKQRDRKEQQRQYVERLLESDLSVSEWCTRYGVTRQSMYTWLSSFAASEPELFGGADNIVDRSKRRWLESTRNNLKASKALALRRPPAVVFVDSLSGDLGPKAERPVSDQASAITVEFRTARIHIPPNTLKSDLSRLLEALSEL
jgi:transposase-like protein